MWGCSQDSGSSPDQTDTLNSANKTTMIYSTITVKEILIEASCGALIPDALKQAIGIAVKEGRRVRFVANGKQFVIEPDHLVEQILRDGKEIKP